ncbi:MAG TPA: multiheme c-type cytochrome [Candidatus Methanoperedens sp.]|nr:multiheme c-type cytochrome [Candidatus Methanoperedens sp.]
MKLLALAAAVLAAGCAARGAPVPPARVGPVVLLAADAGGGARFAGSDACRACHPDAWERWRATGHAAAFAGLPAAGRGDPACLRCHVTGHGDPLGYRGGGGLDLAAVGCEACHGAAADHARSRHPELVPTATGGDCPPCEANRICRLCHTPAHSPSFELARYLARVGCAGGPVPLH